MKNKRFKESLKQKDKSCIYKMASILMLQDYADRGANIYKVFDTIQLKDPRNWHKHFQEVENEEVLRMIYKWLANQSGKVKTV